MPLSKPASKSGRPVVKKKEVKPAPKPAYKDAVAVFDSCSDPRDLSLAQARLRRDLRRGALTIADAKKVHEEVGDNAKVLVHAVIREVEEGGGLAETSHRAVLNQAKAGYLSERKLLTAIYEVLVDILEK